MYGLINSERYGKTASAIWISFWKKDKRNRGLKYHVMKTNLLFDFTIDRKNNRIQVTREFNAGRQLVWDAWTQAEMLDQWWAPKPYLAETKSLDLRVGGTWLYAMVGPEGSRD